MAFARRSSDRLAFLALFAIACTGGNSTGADSGVEADATSEVCPEGACDDPEQIVLPLRIHILQSGVAPLDAQITEEQVTDRLVLVNEIWTQANIAFELEGLQYTQSQNEAGFLEVAEDGTKGPEALAAIGAIIPDSELLRPGWNLVFVQSMVNLPVGVYIADKQVAFVAVNNPSGPTTEPLLSHELGHALSLGHVEDDGVSDNYLNLMCSGPGCSLDREQRNLLTEVQISEARSQATTGDSVTR